MGETIADDNHDIKQDMLAACKDARAAGSSIERLCKEGKKAIKLNLMAFSFDDFSVEQVKLQHLNQAVTTTNLMTALSFERPDLCSAQ